MRKAATLFQETPGVTDKTDSSPPVAAEQMSSPPPTATLRKVPSEEQKKIENEANRETTKEELKLRKTHTERFKNLVSRGRVYLFRTCSIFPFDLFPDELSIEPDQVNISVKSFFQTAESRSIPIKNIADVYMSTTFLFANLKIIDTSYIENSVQVSFLRKNEAEKARRIIQGLILACKEDVDLSKIDPKKLVTEAERIGEMQGVDVQAR